MFNTLARYARAHQPLIKFLGKHSTSPSHPTIHPAAPLDLKHRIIDIIDKRSKLAEDASENVARYRDYWQAPRHLWQSRDITDAEAKAIASGGASTW